MHYYEHNIGDYRRDTAHLSLLEHGVYRQLLDLYYLEESPIPKDNRWVMRRLSAKTEDEQNAVVSVLNDFFLDCDDGWRHHRCDSVIADYVAKCDKNKVNGKKGGRPKSIPEREKTQSVISGLANGKPNESETNPNQEPLTKNHKPKEKSEVDQPPASPPTVAGAICARLKLLGTTGLNPHHPKLIELLKAGITEEELASAAEEPSSKGKSLAWLLAKAEGRRRDAAVENLPAKYEKPWFLTASGIETKASELGVTQEPGEIFVAFRGRVYAAAGVTDEMVRKAKIDAGERV